MKQWLDQIGGWNALILILLDAMGGIALIIILIGFYKMFWS